MNERRQFVPGPAWALLALGAPLAAGGSLLVTASSGATPGRMLVFLVIAFLASIVFAFSVARLRGLPFRACARLSALSAGVSLAGVLVIGLVAVVVLGQV